MDAKTQWPSILGFGNGATITERLVEQNYRKLAKKYHPDAGGSVDDMQQLNLAKDLALKWIENERRRQEQIKAIPIQVAAVQQTFNDLSQFNAYQAQQMAGFAAAVQGYATAAAGQAIADTLKAQREAKEQETAKRWYERMFRK